MIIYHLDYFTVKSPPASADIVLPQPTKAGYSFNGWTKDGASITKIAHGSMGDMSVKAHWNILTYDINDDLDGGTFIGTTANTYTVLDEVVIPELSKPGYEFIGWSGTGLDTLSTSFTLQNAFGDKEYTANFTPNSYKVTFDLVGGSCDANELAVNYDEDVTLPTPRLFGYDFDGWTLSGTPIENTFKWNYLSDINLVATWSQADIVEITTAEELASVA